MKKLAPFIYLLCIMLVIISIAACKQSKKQQLQNIKQEEEKKKIIKSMGVIKTIDTIDEKIFFLSMDTKEVKGIVADNSIDMKDKYGEPITLAQFQVGDIIKTEYEENSVIPIFIQINPEAFEFESVTNLIINIEDKKIQIGNDMYTFTDDTVVIYKDKPISIETITLQDEVTLRGFKNNIWVVLLKKGHGFISLKNQDYYIDGTLEIGSNIIERIKDNMKVAVPVGIYKVVVDKKDFPVIQKEIILEEDQDIVIDLKTSMPKESIVKINIDNKKARVYINGKRYEDLNKQIKLPYGEYQIVAEADGYNRYEDTIQLKEPNVFYDIIMEQKYNSLHVDQPLNTEIYINGDYAGIIPISVPVEPGDYTITLRRQGYYSKNHKITIRNTGQDSYFTFEELTKQEQNNENDDLISNKKVED